MGIVVLGEYLFDPETQPINIAVAKVERSLMRLKRAGLLIGPGYVILHRKGAADQNAGSGAQGHQIWLCEGAPKIISCERLSAD